MIVPHCAWSGVRSLVSTFQPDDYRIHWSTNEHVRHLPKGHRGLLGGSFSKRRPVREFNMLLLKVFLFSTRNRVEPTQEPTQEPTHAPTHAPTPQPTQKPTCAPTHKHTFYYVECTPVEGI